MRSPAPTLARRALPIAITVALAAMAAVALARIDGAPPARAAVVRAASGSFQIANSREGAPIFAATGIAPGESTGGTVTIEDVGSEAVSLKLHRGELVDTPGTGGGVLSGRLQLSVVDITRPAAPRTVYTGPLDSMPDRPVGELAAGEARTYQFTATLPDSGAPSFQNAVQGASTTVAYSWTAEEASGGGEEESGGGGEGGGGGNGGGGQGEGGQSGGGGAGGGTSGGTGAAGSPGGSGTSPPDGGSPRPPGRAFDLTVPRANRAIRGGRLVVWTACDTACRLTVRGRIRATVAGAHRGARIRYAVPGVLAPGTHRLRIPLPRRLRHWILAAGGSAHVRVKLRFTAVAANGERAVVRKALRLRGKAPRR